MTWRRPSSVPVGRVWRRFDGKTHSFEIRDVTDKNRKECLDFMQTIFLRDEPLCQVLGIPSDPASVTSIRENWERYVDQQLTLACYSDTGDLVACNILMVNTRGDEEPDFDSIKGEPWKKLLRTLTTAESLVDVFDYYSVDRYLSSSGLTVNPDYRGQNIGARMFEVREDICRAFNLPATATVFTAITSQVLAAKCQFELLAEMPYSKMAAHGIQLGGGSAQLRGRKFDL